MITKQQVAEAISKAIQRSGKSNEYLAEQMRVHRSRIWELRTGKGNPTVQQLVKLARALRLKHFRELF